MSDWAVFKGPVEILPHPNADSLCIIKVGEYQLVSNLSNGYTEGQVVIVMPDKTVINHEGMRQEEEKYLTGSKKNRVRTVQLRGEVSQGATYPLNKLGEIYDERTVDLVEAAPLFEDISTLLGMEKYEPPIPQELRGQVAGLRLFGDRETLQIPIHKHDVYQWGAFASEFDPDEIVLVTEKVHGSQINYVFARDKNGNVTETVTSKGLLKSDLTLVESGSNSYWRGVRNSGLKEACEKLLDVMGDLDEDIVLHVMGELVPVQKGFSYGFDAPTVLVYSIQVNGQFLRYNQTYGTEGASYITVNEIFPWVPVLANSALRGIDVYELAKGKETVSGKELHIREGIVVTPQFMRKDARHQQTWLSLKVINPKYAAKETGDEVS
jgi:RNA ligase (TIGR02306 family)